MLKLNQFGYITSTRVDIHHKSGRLCTQIKWVMKHIKPVVLIRTSVSKLILNSILDQECQCKELSNVLELIMPSSRDGSTTELPKGGSLTQSPRPLETETGLLMFFLKKVLTLDAEP